MNEDAVRAALDAACEALEPLRATPRKSTPLEGGLTNRNFLVANANGRFVVRISPGGTELLAINRDHEFANVSAASVAGVGAPVIGRVPEHSVMVVGFVDGTTLCDASFEDPAVVARVAAACRQLHAGPRFVNEFDMFDVQRGYLDLCRQRGFRLPAGYEDHLADVERIRAALAVRAEGTVPCNNDLLAGNFIDDGDRVWIIDFEYSGNNDPGFELGNVWSECHLSDDALVELVRGYYGAPRRSRVARARLFGLMSQYGWTLWASIQQATSPIEFDYWGWGMEKYERAVATFGSPTLGTLLDEACRDD